MNVALICDAVKGVKFVLAFEENAPLEDTPTLLWLAAANCDAERDATVVGGKTLIFDARTKNLVRRWPNPVIMNEKTIERVDRRWAEYAIGPFLASPSIRYRALARGDSAACTSPEK